MIMTPRLTAMSIMMVMTMIPTRMTGTETTIALPTAKAIRGTTAVLIPAAIRLRAATEVITQRMGYPRTGKEIKKGRIFF